MLETLATKTEDKALFKELSTPYNINIDSDANSLQSTESEIVSVASQSATDDINDDVSEITTTYNSAILSEEPITQSQYDTTQVPLTHGSEEALSDVSKEVFTTLNPRIEEITNSSHADQATIDPQSPETETSTNIVSQSTTADFDHTNIRHEHSSQYLVTETFESTTGDINYSTTPRGDDQSPDVTNQGALTTKDEIFEVVSKVSSEIKEDYNYVSDYGGKILVWNQTIRFPVESVTLINHIEQSDTSSLGHSSLSSSSSLSLTETTMLSVSTTLKGNTEVINTDGGKTTQKVDDTQVSTEQKTGSYTVTINK